MRRPRTPEEQMRRWMQAGTFAVRHWRGLLIGGYLFLLAFFGFFAWLGFSSRDTFLGMLVFLINGMIVISLLVNLPRRIARFWRAACDAPRVADVGVIDTEAWVQRDGTPAPRPGLRGPDPPNEPRRG